MADEANTGASANLTMDDIQTLAELVVTGKTSNASSAGMDPVNALASLKNIAPDDEKGAQKREYAISLLCEKLSEMEAGADANRVIDALCKIGMTEKELQREFPTGASKGTVLERLQEKLLNDAKDTGGSTTVRKETEGADTGITDATADKMIKQLREGLKGDKKQTRLALDAGGVKVVEPKEKPPKNKR